jgi:hypothetical protein
MADMNDVLAINYAAVLDLVAAARDRPRLTTLRAGEMVAEPSWSMWYVAMTKRPTSF